MDLNIGAALWLAAQAQGMLHGQVEHNGQYRSAARVVLLGHGADELCAGYGRHRTAFRYQVQETNQTCHSSLEDDVRQRTHAMPHPLKGCSGRHCV